MGRKKNKTEDQDQDDLPTIENLDMLFTIDEDSDDDDDRMPDEK